ncbi:MAG TPA: pyridoxal-dependent decarboxylase [Vicinamibacteria bacterium]|nr:pyridoxal-dependent decarboxylase [Vicinamibacteria bacterium]
MSAAPFELEPDRATRERWLEILASLVQDHLDALEHAPAVGVQGKAAEDIVRATRVPVPEEPLPGGIEAAAGILRRAALASYNTPGPGYLAYIPGGGLFASALADLVANALNRYTGISAPAPAFVALEAEVLAWLAGEFGYGPEAAGLFTTGGSLANWSAIVAARHAAFGDSGDFRAAVAYTSSQAHHSVAKALRLAGVPPGNLRAVSVDRRFRADPLDLRARVRDDRARGLRPFLVVAAAGTTNTGAIDPLDELALICAGEGLWLHVDGAYGGAFVLCTEGKTRLRGIERAHSITFDPHKGMFLPYGTGCLLVRDGAVLRAAHAESAAYLQDIAHGPELPPSPADLGPELSRDFRGLRVWLPLMLHGARAFRDALAEKLDLARAFHDGLLRLRAAQLPLEVVDEPQLTVVPFRLARRTDEPLPAWNRRNATFLDAINARERVFLSSTLLPGPDGEVFTLRVCVLSFRTHAHRMDQALEDVAAAAAADPALSSARTPR